MCPIPKSLATINEALSTIFYTINAVSSATAVYSSQGQVAAKNFSDALNSLSISLIQYSSQVILASYIVYGVIFAAFILFAFSIAYKNSGFTQFNIAFGFLLTLFLTILCCLRMIFIPVVGNYCLNPQSNTVDILESQGFTNVEIQTFTYFTDCSATASRQNSEIFQDALRALDRFQSSETLLKEVILKAVDVFSDVRSDATATECAFALTSIYDSIKSLSAAVHALAPGDLIYS